MWLSNTKPNRRSISIFGFQTSVQLATERLYSVCRRKRGRREDSGKGSNFSEIGAPTGRQLFSLNTCAPRSHRSMPAAGFQVRVARSFHTRSRPTDRASKFRAGGLLYDRGNRPKRATAATDDRRPEQPARRFVAHALPHPTGRFLQAYNARAALHSELPAHPELPAHLFSTRQRPPAIPRPILAQCHLRRRSVARWQ